MAQWLSWLERRPVTAEVVGSSPIRVVGRIQLPCRHGGTGRRTGLKILRVATLVPVRFRLPAVAHKYGRISACSSAG